MSHHFDSPTGREDPRLNLCDIYIFPGSPGHTVVAMTVNADAGISAPESRAAMAECREAAAQGDALSVATRSERPFCTAVVLNCRKVVIADARLSR
jgi:hypothetical protein